MASARPDLVTEQLLAEIPDLSQLVLSAAESTTSAGQTARLLSELARAAPNRTIIHDAPATLLGSQLPQLLDLAIENTTSPLPAALELAMRLAPQPEMAAQLTGVAPRTQHGARRARRHPH